MSVAFNFQWSLGDRIRKAREQAGMNQAELAMALPLTVSRQLVSKWERGVAEPTVSEAIAIAKVTGVSALWLLDLDPTMTCFGVPSLSLVKFPNNEQMELFGSADFGLDVPHVTAVTTGA